MAHRNGYLQTSGLSKPPTLTTHLLGSASLDAPAADTIHVWHSELIYTPIKLAANYALLSAIERQRAERFQYEHDRQRYILAHGLLRTVLGRYIDRPSASLEFDLNPFGKPHLKGTGRLPELYFNLSHSLNRIAFAVALVQIGIDFEYVRPIADAMLITRDYFLPSETHWLSNLPSDAQTPAFFCVWTRKEAYLKAIGDGLNLDLKTVDTRPQARPLLHTWHPLTPTHHVQSLDPVPGFACALVAPVEARQVVCYAGI
jgi:4'-phosphopantetheinyl transferase